MKVKINKHGIIIIILSILIILAIISSVIKAIRPDNGPTLTFVYNPVKVEKTFNLNSKELSKKYKAYEEIFNITEPTLIYGYNTTDFNTNFGYRFHSKLSKEIKKNHLNIKVISYPDIDFQISKLEQENCKQTNGAICSTSKESEEYHDFIEPIVDCLYNLCLVYPNMNYVKIDRHSNSIIEEISNIISEDKTED